ncbi:NAD(P)H-binding protein [Nocardia sp. SYP-A9097]|uniref:NAD(P)H-binding protein n=1 Tax=Nocardia sp. SYP-A9097 TaxID=2663237 RepID=UPI00129A40B6|nr:NAD(P)H-binding protein [Nocardia sp. SYP-A9097]MRH93399.1 NAD(P)H-binding protein [Nocardia sp. SYP-A9097]
MIVITGATGTVGRETVQLLLDAGHKVKAVSRTASGADMPDGVEMVVGDPSQPQTLRAVWEGSEAVLLIPRAVGNAAAELLAAAAEHGARRVVVISAATVEYPAGESRFAEGFMAVEDAAKASGLIWTFLRCSDFDANSLAWAPQIHAGDVVRGAYGAAATSPIHQRDIAAVAVKALTAPDHASRAYVLTGPESLTQRDKVRIIGEALGRTLSFAELAPEQVRAAMLAQGLPDDVPDRLLGSLADYAREAGPTTDTVRKLLGRPALSFAVWAVENAGAFQ